MINTDAKISERQILINLCASMGLADHLGDVASDVWKALTDVGLKPPSEVGDLSELMEWLGREHGATTVWGTSVVD